MNGIASNLKDEIKKSHELKHKEKIKFFLALLITNLLVAILCLPSTNESRLTVSKKILHQSHQMMLLPLTVLIPKDFSSQKESAITILSPDKKIIVPKAFLHEEMKEQYFKIEIPNESVKAVGNFTEEGMVAIPYVENKKSIRLYQGSKYEISL